MNTINAYWWSPRRTPRGIARGLWESPALWATRFGKHDRAFTNHGDELNALVLPEISGHRVRWVPLGREDLIGIGSIIDLYIQKHGRGLIFGSGARGPHQAQDDAERVRPRVLAVRGPLTQRAFDLPPTMTIGDPALVIRAMRPSGRIARSGKVFVPHFDDYATVHGLRVISTYRTSGYRIAHPTTESRVMIDRLAGAEHVVSSGLHGVIMAHALHTPATLVSTARVTPATPGWKYRDYLASVGLPTRIVGWSEPLTRPHVHVELANEDVEACSSRIDHLVTALFAAASPLR